MTRFLSNRPAVAMNEPIRVAKVFPKDAVDPDALRVVRRLRKNNFNAYLVGGCVRDLLLGREPKDFDVATDAKPNEIRSVFQNSRIIGRRFRLAHVLFSNGKIIETATFRKDPGQVRSDDAVDAEEFPLEYNSSERDDVALMLQGQTGETDVLRVEDKEVTEKDWLIRHDNTFGEPHEDAVRRDFTVNALFYDPDTQEVIDYVGGYEDINHRILIPIGHPEVRFKEDPIRMLRAIKFSARLDLGIPDEVVHHMMALKQELHKAAPARLVEECLRLMRQGSARKAYALLDNFGYLEELFPTLAPMVQSERGIDFWKRLSAVDKLVRNGITLSDTVLVTSLLNDMLIQAMLEKKNAALGFSESFDAMNATLPFPRKIKEKVRYLLWAQKRVEKGKKVSLKDPELAEDFKMHHAIQKFVQGQIAQSASDGKHTKA